MAGTGRMFIYFSSRRQISEIYTILSWFLCALDVPHLKSERIRQSNSVWTVRRSDNHHFQFFNFTSVKCSVRTLFHLMVCASFFSAVDFDIFILWLLFSSTMKAVISAYIRALTMRRIRLTRAQKRFKLALMLMNGLFKWANKLNNFENFKQFHPRLLCFFL